MTWSRFKELSFHDAGLGLTVDLSRMNFDSATLDALAPKFAKAFADMAALEGGAIANPDEGRMVGHYWLRAPKLAPEAAITAEIESTLAALKEFATKAHSGAVSGPEGKFENVLVIGIGGSALGPPFVAQALGNPGADRMRPFFFDNTDPDGMDQTLGTIGD
jgi:glucose-6-phosphate isomerase